MVKPLALIAISACLLAACGSSQPAARPTSTPVAQVQSPSDAGPSPSPSQQTPGSVFVIVMENRNYDAALAGGYTAQLANTYSVAHNYHGVSHPSLPNYLALTSGSTWGVADDGWHALPSAGLGKQLTDAGVSWRAYMEGMSRSCMSSPYPYALKHDPFAYFGAACPQQVVPFTDFAGDMQAGNVARFVWITPDLCNDGHDCSTSVADAWLSRVVPEILATDAWKNHGVLVLTWDEGEDSANHILTVVIQPDAAHEVSDRYYDHYSLLATIEDRLGVPRLGQAKSATPMSDLVLSGSG